jgi:hypothetical protein
MTRALALALCVMAATAAVFLGLVYVLSGTVSTVGTPAPRGSLRVRLGSWSDTG